MRGIVNDYLQIMGKRSADFGIVTAALEHDDRGCYARFAQPDAFGYTRDAERIHITQVSRNIDQSVAVALCLDDGHNAAATGGATQTFKIPAQRVDPDNRASCCRH